MGSKICRVSRSWLVLAGVIILLESIFIYEALLADLADQQRMFGVFAGLAILCFAALLYEMKVVFYD